ncbi:hypothetical protein P4126_33815 [Pseudomonas aeruginosa]|nr:hypothetical protein [Pseudomonas aeruginosa]
MLEADSLDNRSGGLVSADVTRPFPPGGSTTVRAKSPARPVTLDVAEQLDSRGGKAIGDSGLRPRRATGTQPGRRVLASRDGLRLNGAELFNGNGRPAQQPAKHRRHSGRRIGAIRRAA